MLDQSEINHFLPFIFCSTLSIHTFEHHLHINKLWMKMEWKRYNFIQANVHQITNIYIKNIQKMRFDEMRRMNCSKSTSHFLVHCEYTEMLNKLAFSRKCIYRLSSYLCMCRMYVPLWLAEWHECVVININNSRYITNCERLLSKILFWLKNYWNYIFIQLRAYYLYV